MTLVSRNSLRQRFKYPYKHHQVSYSDLTFFTCDLFSDLAVILCQSPSGVAESGGNFDRMAGGQSDRADSDDFKLCRSLYY